MPDAPLPQVRHEAVSASAGSGKTFRLAHRFIRLLALDVAPERIVALTFSRKAAGEIFDSIVTYLRKAAVTPHAARNTGRQIEDETLAPEDFLRLLRRFINNLHRLHIGTLDSFIVGVVRAFPAELGIPRDFQVMDNESTAALDVQEQALADIFNPHRRHQNDIRTFLEAFKQATFGREEKRLTDLLSRFIGDCRGVYQSVPRDDAWGRPETIWSAHPSPWLQPVRNPAATAEQLLDELRTADLGPDIMERWVAFADAAAGFRSGTPLSTALTYLLGRLASVYSELGRSEVPIKIGRKSCPLTPGQGRQAARLVRHVLGESLRGALRQTRGIYDVLSAYEGVYDQLIRRQGRLTFSDAQYLLTPSNPAGGTMLSRMPGREDRLFIDYRLDCALDHWLLDEFQDTSDLQWQVLQPLADEILQDDSGRRSFFYVGDIKQAIYGWRGGNARLFQAILDRYGKRIHQVPLARSFRSCQPVIDVVNRVFGHVDHPELPAGATARWNKIWQEHSVAREHVPADGYAAILEPPCDGGDTKPTDEDRYRLTARLVDTIAPTRRGLSFAVLVRDNRAGRDVADVIRRECPHVPCVHEGHATILDNAVVPLLLSLVRLAVHPGNRFARRHVEMSPLAPVLARAFRSRADLTAGLLAQIHASGFRECIRHWGAALADAAPLDGFGRLRLGDLVDAAAEYDQSGDRDVDRFLQFAENHQIHEQATGDAVRVMTVHQAKGLGFDVVVLPDLMGRASLGRARHVGLVAARNPEETEPRWVLQTPPRLVCEQDEVLRRQIEIEDENACFDELCVLYVAMTRARRAMIMITSFPGKSSALLNAAALLKESLVGDPKPTSGSDVLIGDGAATCLFECGNRAWFSDVPVQPESGAVAEPPAEPLARRLQAAPLLQRVEPSGREQIRQPASILFGREMEDVLDFGTAIHELFEQVVWWDDADVDAIVEQWQARAAVAPDVVRDVVTQFRSAMQQAAVRKALSKPAGKHVELWREKRFEVVLEAHNWVSGIFDRVEIHRNARNAATRAVILDYKSDRIDRPAQFRQAVQRYHPQLELYRQALSRILALDPARIDLRLLFTRTGTVMPA